MLLKLYNSPLISTQKWEVYPQIRVFPKWARFDYDPIKNANFGRGWKFWDSPPQFVVKSSWGEWAAGNCNCFLFIQFEFKVNYVALIQILKEKQQKQMKLGGHYLVDMVCLLVSRKQKEKLREGWFRVVTFQQLCKHSGIYDSRFRGNRNLSSMWQKFMSSSAKIVFLKHRFKQFPNSLMVNICRKSI